ncbi:Annexin-like protein RJ4 [Dichanthelium oligosanthes]|uniref:Annexin-like protein RJ4 n=1 Tax=Dichanthelium oligosanthes TaxID=888268 RepID=A0A1E5VGM3_9POAL|nr:Annexin-like protein RJ4 [Dichanthelium oligosanthes]
MATNTVSQVVPSPAEDAAALLKAFQGWGTDEQAVIAILAHRDAAQRKQIMLKYEQMYSESLTQRLQSELSGDFERAMYHWILDPVERQAVMANAATKCIQEEYPVIVEIACANSSAELIAVKKAYHDLYKCSLEEDVAAGTTGNLRSLLLALVSTYRYDGDDVNMGLAKSEAKIVHEAVRNGTTDHAELIRIVGTRSKAQLNATFSCFKDEHSSSITKALPHGTDPTGYLRALRTAVRCIADADKYFAKVLRNAMRESGTDEDSLTRVVVMHAEKDMKGISGAFRRRSSVTLEQAIAKETSGDYRSFLMALLGS